MNKWPLLILLFYYFKLVFILMNEWTHGRLTEEQCFPAWSSFLCLKFVCSRHVNYRHKSISEHYRQAVTHPERSWFSFIPPWSEVLLIMWQSQPSLLSKLAWVNMKFPVRGPEHSRQLYSIISIYLQRMVGSGSSQRNLFVCPVSGTCSQVIGV